MFNILMLVCSTLCNIMPPWFHMTITTMKKEHYLCLTENWLYWYKLYSYQYQVSVSPSVDTNFRYQYQFLSSTNTDTDLSVSVLNLSNPTPILGNWSIPMPIHTNLFYTDTNTGYRLNSNQFDMNMGSVNSLMLGEIAKFSPL